MERIDLKGKHVAVLGLGARGGGVGTVKFLADCGADILVSDQKQAQDLPSLSEIKGFPVKLRLGDQAGDIFPADLIVRNPAVPRNSPVLIKAREWGVPVLMESSLFFMFSPTSKIIGVTGTKGKTTLVFWLSEALKRAGYKVEAGGNFGRSMLSLIPDLSPEHFAILELSSFQLEGLEEVRKSPAVAVITSLFPDHLNRYESFEEYIRAKSNIFRFQKGNDLLFLGSRVKKHLENFAVCSRTHELIGHEPHELGSQLLNFLGIKGDFSDLRVEAPYRRQEIGVKEGVLFINDSCATNPGATLFALENMPKVVLLAGGTDKNLDYRELGSYLAKKRIPMVLLSGSATEKLKRSVPKENILGEFSDLFLAVKNAFLFAKQMGLDVLFSPAATSFELFRNENERGARFNAEVQKL